MHRKGSLGVLVHDDRDDLPDTCVHAAAQQGIEQQAADCVEVVRHGGPDGRFAGAQRRQQATGCDSQYGVVPGKRYR